MLQNQGPHPQTRRAMATTEAQAQCFIGRTFWVDPKCFGGFQDEHYTGTVQRLERLGATVAKFLEARVDCLVLARAEREAASAPSTPTGTSSASARGISARAQRLQSGCGSSWPKSATSRAALQPSPAQFADSHGKQVLSAGELLERLQGAEKRRDKRSAGGLKRSRMENTAEGKGPKPLLVLAFLQRVVSASDTRPRVCTPCRVTSQDPEAYCARSGKRG
jgi:hypothetical protein